MLDVDEIVCILLIEFFGVVEDDDEVIWVINIGEFVVL